MERQYPRKQTSRDWPRLKERLIYLPGGVILAYGFWLSLTV